MQQFVLGDFVLKDELVFEPFGDGYFVMAGNVECVGSIVLQVRKLLAVLGEPGPKTQVQTVEYSYNASIEGLGNILRYDSPHPSHNQFHHVHRYDPLHGDGIGTVEMIDDDGWPTLGEVLDELRVWYYSNFDTIRRMT